MAQAAVQFDKQRIFCKICSKDSATLPCGHNYCWSCIQSYWGRGAPSVCPQCRQRINPSHVLVTNTMLADVAEQLKKTDLQQNQMASHLLNNAQRHPQAKRNEIILMIKEKEIALQKLQQEANFFRHYADEAVKHSEQSLGGLCRMLEYIYHEVSREIRALQEREETKLKQIHDQLQLDITELRKAVSELDSLAPLSTFQHWRPPSAMDHPRTYSVSLGTLEQVSTAVRALTDPLKVSMTDGLQNILQCFRADHPAPQPQAALSLPEPKTRQDFINYTREIILDQNTAHHDLKLSRENRRATNMGFSPFLFFRDDPPERFNVLHQVLSKDGLMGRCYWEVEWSSFNVVLSVSYKTIARKGDLEECEFGYNDKSWALDCTKYSFSFWHNNIQTKGSQSVSDRVGVFLDHSAGVLAFYNIDENQTMELLHRIQTSFTEPLYAGVKFPCSRDTAHFPKLK